MSESDNIMTCLKTYVEPSVELVQVNRCSWIKAIEKCSHFKSLPDGSLRELKFCFEICAHKIWIANSLFSTISHHLLPNHDANYLKQHD